MTGAEYQRYALRTWRGAGRVTQRTMLVEVALGLTGESGEVADRVKKERFQDHPPDNAKLLEEFGDVLWYLAVGCEILGVSLDHVMAANIRKLERRYAEGFSRDASLNRDVVVPDGGQPA